MDGREATSGEYQPGDQEKLSLRLPFRQDGREWLEGGAQGARGEPAARVEMVPVVIGEAQVVIIGSGAFGSSIAYHLAALGHRDVALVDAHEIASQTSPRAAGLTRQVRFDADMSRLAISSVEKITRFTAETGQPLTYVQSGSVNMARTDSTEATVHAEIDAGQALGLGTRRLSIEEMASRAPLIRPQGIRLAAYTPSDVYLEQPGQLPLGYASASQQRGVTLLPHTRVTGIGIEGGRVTKVVAETGVIRTPVVVDAAGAWARLVAERIGLRVPIVPVRHQLYITGRIPGVEAGHAICRLYDVAVYLRPHDGGLLLGVFERDPELYDMHAFPQDFQIGDLPLDFGVLDRVTRSIRTQLAIGADVPVREHRGGLPTMTPDGRPIVGPVPGVEGFYVATGCCVGGLSISPAVGELVAEAVHTARPSPSLDPFAITRFAYGFDVEEALHDGCRRQYADFYAMMPEGEHREGGARSELQTGSE
jgi:glycine/D-amino acid oxidase-like deaminating enzyme